MPILLQKPYFAVYCLLSSFISSNSVDINLSLSKVESFYWNDVWMDYSYWKSPPEKDFSGDNQRHYFI